VLKGLEGKTAVVTGAGAGIGAATVTRLVAEGVRVVAADIDGGAVQALAGTLGAAVVPLKADVSSPDGAASCVQAAVDAFGRLDLFHANAGVEGRAHLVRDFDRAVFDQVFNVNVLGAFLCAQAAVRRFEEQQAPGNLLFTASLSSLTGNASVAVYNASKHALHALMRCLARETGPLIRVNMVAPGAVDTRMMRSLEDTMGALAGTDAAGFKTAVETANPLGRYASAEEIAATAAWMLSDEVPYLHGEVVTVSGGTAP
jgi:NAD(P)-dependent dehydrogenase (short-subunit alcohol dehydrogenase family)